MYEPPLSSRAHILAYIALLANVLIGMVNIGWANMFVAVTIAALRGSIIALILMHGLLQSGGLIN